jgi:hypothetical protein
LLDYGVGASIPVPPVPVNGRAPVEATS